MGKKPDGMLEWLKSKTAKITGLILAVAALVTAAVGLQKQVTSLIAPWVARLHPPPPAVKFPDCFKAGMKMATQVTLDRWQDSDLVMTGSNNCHARQIVFVRFVGERSEAIRVEPPYSETEDCTSADCWGTISVDPGDLNLNVVPPHLRALKRPLGQSTSLSLNWTIRSSDNTIFGAGHTRITIVDNPQTLARTADLPALTREETRGADAPRHDAVFDWGRTVLQRERARFIVARVR